METIIKCIFYLPIAIAMFFAIKFLLLEDDNKKVEDYFKKKYKKLK